MIVRKKHVLVVTVLLIFSAFILYINISWGNSFKRSFSLSGMTFLLIFLSFSLAWEIRDFWQFRWFRVESLDINIDEIQIPVPPSTTQNLSQTFLVGDIIRNTETAKNNAVVVFTHGFTDDSILTRYITVPIAQAGFDVISYDCRGTNRSRKVGKSSDFVNIVKDLEHVIKFVKSQDKMKDRDVVLVGMSLGAVSSIYQGLRDESIKKTIAIAAISNFQDILPTAPIPFRGKWWLWLRYRLKGVLTNPEPNINYILSPGIQLKDKKEKTQNELEWSKFINQKLCLIHAKNDKIIPFSHFQNNLEITNLETENYVITERGGHNFLKYELAILSKIIEEIKKVR